MAFYKNKAGEVQHVEISPEIYKEAVDKNLKVAHLINTKYGEDVDDSNGTAFQQICASEGLSLVGANPFGLRASSLHDILEGKAGFNVGPANTKGRSDPFGNQVRTLFPIAVLELIEDMFYENKADDDVTFRSLVKTTMPIAGDTYRQPILSYEKAGGANKGPNAAKAARVTQLGEVPNMLTITTSEKSYSIPAYGIGIEMSDEAMKGTTLDIFGMTMKRYIDIEHNARVGGYLSDLFLGDIDRGMAAVPSVTTVALDPSCPAGKVTHKAWLKFLARNRRRRRISHAMCTLDTYLKIEAREGRPGSHAYDPRLATIDPQFTPAKLPGFGNDVQWLITDAPEDGGPVPEGVVWALDKEQAIKMITNTEADYRASEQFVLRRSSRMIWTWSEVAERLYTDDTSAFDVLVIS